MRKLIYIFGLIFILIGSFFGVSGCEQFGDLPSAELQKKISLSKNFNPEISEFVNRKPNIIKDMGKGHGFWSDPMKRIRHNFFFNNNQTTPDSTLPENSSPVPITFRESNNNIKFIWLGHSSILLSINNKIILIDPVFSSYASPVPGIVGRFQPPVLKLSEIPKIDFILISHDHYDHLDMKTIKFFREKDIRFIVPLGVSPHLQRWGVPKIKISEFDWWQEFKIGGLMFICTPAQHFSGRMGPYKDNKSLWASWVVKSSTKSFYFSGDSGYDTHYKDIGSMHGPFDLVFMDSGQYNVRWKAVHNMPNEVIKGFQDLRGRNLVPIHWGMFSLSLHNWYDPITESYNRAKEKGLSIMTPKLGELVELNKKNIFEKWWEAFIERK